MYLFFDTETTGLPINWGAPIADIDNWPRLVQIAWQVYDNNRNNLSSMDFIIKPEGFIIPDEASKIHGITTEKAMKIGYNLKYILEIFSKEILNAQYLVAHNMDFDEKIVGAEFIRNNIKNELFSKLKICTMQKSTNYCKIPGEYGYKWPKLSELYKALFGIDFKEAHNASADINATVKCFWKMQDLNIV